MFFCVTCVTPAHHRPSLRAQGGRFSTLRPYRALSPPGAHRHILSRLQWLTCRAILRLNAPHSAANGAARGKERRSSPNARPPAPDRGRRAARDRLPPDRAPDPLRPERPHPQRGAGRADRRLDPRVRLHQPGAGRWRERHHRRPRPGAGGAQARPRLGAGDRARPPHRRAEAGVRAGRQQARRAGRLGSRAARPGARRAGGARHRSRLAGLRGARARCAPRQRAARSTRGGDARAAGGAGIPAGRSLASRPAPAALRQLDRSDRRSAAARRRDPAADGQRSALRGRVRSELAQPGRRGQDPPHRQGAERRPGRLARGLGAVSRRGRLCLARRPARGRGRREPRGLRLRDPVARSSGRRSGWCSPAATTTGSTSPASTR